MKRLIILGICAVVIIGFVLVYLLSGNKQTATTQPPSNVFNTPGTTATTTTVQQTKITLLDGRVATVPVFTEANQPSWASAQAGYQVSGDSASGYQILYYPQDSGFLISLLQEPLGANRRAAEAALRQKLGLSDNILCTLKYQVSTSQDVNETYAGENLGLSFCPNAVPLP